MHVSESLRRVFYDAFVARDVAEPLPSLDGTADPNAASDLMTSRSLAVLGVREDGIVTGFVRRESLQDVPLSKQMTPLEEACIVATTTSLRDVVQKLNDSPFVLVTTLGQPVGWIQRQDLEKPPMRMWLFGMVTLFELSATQIINQHYADDSWRQFMLVTASP